MDTHLILKHYMNNKILELLEECHGKTVQTTVVNEDASVDFVFSDGSVLKMPDALIAHDNRMKAEPENFIPKDHHIIEDADGERFVKNDNKDTTTVEKNVEKNVEKQTITKDDVGELKL